MFASRNFLFAKSAGAGPAPVVEGQLWIWGMGSFGIGTLGQNNSTVSQSSPVQVGSATNWTYSAVSTYVALAVNSAGQLWAWGNDSTFGSLGLNDLVNRSSPVQVGSLTNWKSVFNDQQVACAIKTDGTLWAWGRNTQGQLGQGDTTNRSSPVQIGSSTDWVTASLGGAFGGTFAINSSGQLWATGRNFIGQLGLGDTTDRSSLTQVGSLTNWKNVFIGQASSHAIKTDGTLWAWGRNYYGVLGTGNTTARSSPVQVGALTDWATLRKGAGYSKAGIKTGGTLWTWGRGSQGALGLNNTTDYSSPKQVGSLSSWSKIANAGNYGCLAIRTNGTLWSWGTNTNGALGLGNTTNYSSPKQIGSLTTWVVAGPNGSNGYNTAAIKTP